MWLFAWHLAVGSKAAWIPSRDGLKTVGVGAKVTANTSRDSKRASRLMDRKRCAQNDMATAGSIRGGVIVECKKSKTLRHFSDASDSQLSKDFWRGACD